MSLPKWRGINKQKMLKTTMLQKNRASNSSFELRNYKLLKFRADKNKIAKIFLFGIVGILCLQIVMAAANLQVSSFSCSPSESAINSVFSCTAQINNVGDASGSVSTATLYPDSGNWLESSSYPQASGVSVSPGQSTEVTFTGLRAIKSGNNGFSKIMLDSVTDTYVADNNKKVNIVNVIVTVSNSVSSAAKGATFDSTAEVTAGGNVDVSLAFTVDSGGCSIGSQTNPKTISGMSDGSKQSRSWTVTQGTTGNCAYTISASATGTSGVASKTDSTPSAVTCTDCPVTSSTTTTTGGGGGGGGEGTGAKVFIVGELISAQEAELANGEKISFNISGAGHTLTLKNHTETNAVIDVQSEKQTFTLIVGDEIKVDLNNDNVQDISIKLKSINVITKKVNLILSPISGASSGIENKAPPANEAVNKGEGEKNIGAAIKSNKIVVYLLVGIFIILAIISGVYYFILKKRKKSRLLGENIRAWKKQ